MQNIIYSVPVSPKIKGQTPIYRSPIAKDYLQKVPQFAITMQKLWTYIRKKNGNLKCLQNYTYNDVQLMSKIVGSWLIKNNHKTLYFHSKNRWQWAICDIACFKYGIISVPIYDTLGKQALNHIIKLTEGDIILSTQQTLKTLLKYDLENIFHIKSVILLEQISSQLELKLSQLNIKPFLFSQILADASLEILTQKNMKPDDHMTYCFTSGTTALPKGVVITQSNFSIKIYSTGPSLQFEQSYIHLSYLPLAHMFQRTIHYSVMLKGGNIKYYSGIVTQLTKDFIKIKPNILTIVPRLLNLYYSILRNFSHVDSKRAQKAFELKKQGWLKGINNQVDPQVFKPAKDTFGGRVKIMLTGSAPISAQILDFFRIVLDCGIRQGYGQTQTTSGAFLTHKNDIKAGHVGGPNNFIEFKLIDIPELNYSSQNNPVTGEICIRGYTVFKEYFKDQKNTKQTIDSQGWLHTGDVGLLQSNGSVKIIDRKKNIYKLSQGEYIAPQKIQNIYLRCLVISEIFIYGNSLKSYNVAIIVPNKDAIEKYAQSLKIKQSFEDLCKNNKIIQYIYNQVTKQAKKDGLLGFQIAKKIKLNPISFSNYGIFTSTLKMQRHIAKKVFEKDLQGLYKE